MVLLKLFAAAAFLESLIHSKHRLSRAHDLKNVFGPPPPEISFELPEFDFHFISDGVQGFRPQTFVIRGSPGEVAIRVPFEQTGTLERKPFSLGSKTDSKDQNLENQTHSLSEERPTSPEKAQTPLPADAKRKPGTLPWQEIGLSTTLTESSMGGFLRKSLQDESNSQKMHSQKTSGTSAKHRNESERFESEDTSVSLARARSGKEDELETVQRRQQLPRFQRRPWISAQPETANIMEPFDSWLNERLKNRNIVTRLKNLRAPQPHELLQQPDELSPSISLVKPKPLIETLIGKFQHGPASLEGDQAEREPLRPSSSGITQPPTSADRIQFPNSISSDRANSQRASPSGGSQSLRPASSGRSPSGRSPSSRPASSGRSQSSRQASSGRSQSSRPTSSGRSQSSRPSSSGGSQSSKPGSSGRSQSSRPASSGRSQSSRPASSGRSQSSRTASSGRSQSSRPASSGRSQSFRPASSDRSQSSRPASSGRSQSSITGSSGQTPSPRSTSSGGTQPLRSASFPRLRSPRPVSSGGPHPSRINSDRRAAATAAVIPSITILNGGVISAASTISQTRAIPIDNGVVGDPEIICGPTSITVIFNTENPFEGNVFVKGLFNDDQCRVIGQDNARIAAIELPFETCGVARQRSLNPRGVFVSVTVIASFHPSFVTKVDRAVRAQCFYMEADKTVDTELEVSALTTGPDDIIDRQVLMPICRYEILDGGPNGNPLRFALIGQQVYHQWTCDSETTDTFCMTVYDCYVDDTSGDRIQLIDEDGCALDKHILNNLEYPSDLQAGVEAHVFKYADRPSTYYNCQIKIEIKEPEGDCVRPQCPEPPRRKRSAENPDKAYVVDVSIPNPILVGDIDLSEDDVPSALLHPTYNKYSNPYSNWTPNTVSAHGMKDGVCMSPTGFGILISIGALFIVATLTMSTLLCMRRTPNKNREF